MARFDPRKVVSIDDRLVRRAAEQTIEKWSTDVGGAIDARHEGSITQAYLTGTAFEFSRRTGKVVGEALVTRMGPGARRWFRLVKKSVTVNTCDAESWRNILINSFERGVQDADSHLRKISGGKKKNR